MYLQSLKTGLTEAHYIHMGITNPADSINFWRVIDGNKSTDRGKSKFGAQDATVSWILLL